MPKVHMTFVPESAFQGSFDADLVRVWIPVTCRGGKTPDDNRRFSRCRLVWDGVPQHPRWQRASLCTCRCVLGIHGADHLLQFPPAYPGFVVLLAARSCVITCGTLGSFTAETRARLAPISCSTVVYCTYTAAPLKTLSISVNHIEQWVKWSWISNPLNEVLL